MQIDHEYLHAHFLFRLEHIEHTIYIRLSNYLAIALRNSKSAK